MARGLVQAVPSPSVKLRGPASWPSLAAPFVAALVAILLFAGSGSASGPGAPTCLGPEVGRALEGLVKAQAFQGVVPSGFKLERLDVKPDHVEMGYDDATGPAVTVLLTLPGAESGPPVAAHGPHFEHRIVDERSRASGPDRDAMLRAAMVVDRAIPAEAMECKGGASEAARKRAPTSFELGIGAAEAGAVLVAVAWVVVRRRQARSKSEQQTPEPPPPTT